jgi:polar amino acid transport system substrate-binding protein
MPARLLLVALALISLAPLTLAQETLEVGVKEARPFVYRDASGEWTGLSVELWRSIALKLGVSSNWQEEKLDPLLRRTGAGELDAGVGALTVTAERETMMDFSHPFMSSGLAIAVPGHPASGGIFSALFSLAFLQAVGALVGVLIIAGSLVWFFERRANPDEFGGKNGLWEGFWWSAVTMTTVGYGDRSPKTVPGRIVALIWMFASIIVISFFTASIASTLTVRRLESDIEGPDDLARASVVATVKDSVSSAWLRRRELKTKAFDTLEEALQAVADGKAEAAVYDEPLLRYQAKTTFAGDIVVLPGVFERQDYAFALPNDSPRREEVNRALLEVLASPAWRETLRRYLGD